MIACKHRLLQMPTAHEAEVNRHSRRIWCPTLLVLNGIMATHIVTPDACTPWHVEMCMHTKHRRPFYVGMHVHQTQVIGPAAPCLASNAATCANFIRYMSILTADDLSSLSPTGATKSNGLSDKTEMAGSPHLRMSQIRAATPMIRTLRAAVN